MKIILFVFITLTFLSSCSLQSDVSPETAINRLSEYDENISINASELFYSGNSAFCFVTYNNVAEIVIKFECDEERIIKKISLFCNNSEKADDFIACAKALKCIFYDSEFNDNSFEKLFKNDFDFFETKSFLYSSAVYEKKLCFYIENKKTELADNDELTLKNNDIYDY